MADLDDMVKKADKKKGNSKKTKKPATSKKKAGVVNEGDMIRVEYEGKFTDGKVFDSSKRAGRPLEFQAGNGMVIKGFDKAVIGMEPGEEKNITVKPEEGYGNPNPELVREVPKPPVPEGQKLEKGAILMLALPNGQKIPAKVVDLKDDTIKIDLNHPLAGKTLKFKIKVLDIL